MQNKVTSSYRYGSQSTKRSSGVSCIRGSRHTGHTWWISGYVLWIVTYISNWIAYNLIVILGLSSTQTNKTMKIFMQKFPVVAMAAIVMLLFMITFSQEKCIDVMFVRKSYEVKNKTKKKQTIKKTLGRVNHARSTIRITITSAILLQTRFCSIIHPYFHIFLSS